MTTLEMLAALTILLLFGVLMAVLVLLRRSSRPESLLPPTAAEPEALEPEPEPDVRADIVRVPRSVERAGRILVWSVGALALAMGIEYLQGVWSAPGATIDSVLEHARKLCEAVWKISISLVFISYVVDHVAYRRFSLLELFTNKAAEWRTDAEPFVPFSSTHAQAAAILGYFLLITTIVGVFRGARVTAAPRPACDRCGSCDLIQVHGCTRCQRCFFKHDCNGW